MCVYMCVYVSVCMCVCVYVCVEGEMTLADGRHFQFLDVVAMLPLPWKPIMCRVTILKSD